MFRSRRLSADDNDEGNLLPLTLHFKREFVNICSCIPNGEYFSNEV